MEELPTEQEDTNSVTRGNSNFCIICCKSCISVCQDKEEENNFIDKLVKFEDELNEVVFKSHVSKISETSTSITRSVNGKRSSIKNKIFSGTGYLYDKKVYKVCQDCKTLMTSAFTSKGQLDEMENHVRYLQMAILRALKILDRNLGQFNQDLNKLGNVIQLSTEKEKDKILRKITQKNSKSINSTLSVGALGFRQCILNAVSNLDQFRKGNKSKNVDNFENNQKPFQNHPDEIGQEDDDPANTITASTMEIENNTEDHDDDNWLPDNDNDPYDDMKNDEESEHENITRPKRKYRKRSSAKINDDDLLTEVPRAYFGKRYSSILDQVTTSMSPFKAAIVRRTLNKTKRKPRKTEPEGPLASHFVTYNATTDVLSVDNQIEIHFNEFDMSLQCTQCSFRCKGPENEKSSSKETNGNPANSVERKMMYHILGKHLNIFKCEKCDKQMTSYHQYFKHREIHKKMGSGAEPVCELCGKVLKSVESFEDHKWVHMTEEEKEEMRRQGKKDPKEKFANIPRKYQCQVCGKGFRRPCELRLHMRGGA